MPPQPIDISTFKTDSSLASDLSVYIVVKGFNQQAITNKIIQRKGARGIGLTVHDDPMKRRYSQGLVFLTTLNTTEISFNDVLSSSWRYQCFEPFDVVVINDIQYIASANWLIRCSHDNSTICGTSNPWMAFLHSIATNSDASKLLVASAGFDTIMELDLKGKVLWSWCAWDSGLDYSHAIKRSLSRIPGCAKSLLVDPILWPLEGLPTPCLPLRLNGVEYDDYNNRLLATAYHRTELLLIDKGKWRIGFRDLELQHPHSFRRIADFYQVVDTGRGVVHRLDEDLQIIASWSVAGLEADPLKRRYFGEWLQTGTTLSARGDLLGLVDGLRSGIHLLDLSKRRRRFISFPENWSVQAIRPANPG